VQRLCHGVENGVLEVGTTSEVAERGAELVEAPGQLAKVQALDVRTRGCEER
jgi:hypothetical protein